MVMVLLQGLSIKQASANREVTTYTVRARLSPGGGCRCVGTPMAYMLETGGDRTSLIPREGCRPMENPRWDLLEGEQGVGMRWFSPREAIDPWKPHTGICLKGTRGDRTLLFSQGSCRSVSLGCVGRGPGEGSHFASPLGEPPIRGNPTVEIARVIVRPALSRT